MHADQRAWTALREGGLAGVVVRAAVPSVVEVEREVKADPGECSGASRDSDGAL